jgi:ADP-heptose:LPS heptosyltransferase
VSAERILIVNLTRFGDLLQTSPTIVALRERHPGVAITLLAERNFADVCDGIPGIDRVYRVDLDRLGNLVLSGGDALIEGYRYVEDVIHELRAARFDLALNFSSSRMTAVFMGLLGIPDVRGWSMTTDGLRVIRHPWARLFATMCLNRRVAAFNLVDYYRAMAGGGGATRRLLYDISPAAGTFADALLAAAGVQSGDRLVALQLGASRAIRQWPAAAFAALGRHLAAAGHRVVLTGGGADRALAATVAADLGAHAIDASGKTGVAELGALLARTHLLVSGDTGPMHMAAAVGTPIVGLFFGPASPFDTGPYGADHVLLHATASCGPCDHNVSCLNAFCRDEITPEAVATAVGARLAGDWGAIESLARTRTAMRVYRTAFDVDGLYCCRLIGTPPLEREDALRRAYRATWLAVLGVRPGRARRTHDAHRLLAGVRLLAAAPGTIDVAPFAALARLARDGEETAHRLATEAGQRAFSLDEIERLGRELDILDRTLLEHGGVHADTAVLTQMFKFGKENLEGDDVATLARETAALYGELALEADLMTALLGGAAVEEHEADACLHQ